MGNNLSKEVRRTLAAHTLKGTTETTILRGVEQRRHLQQAQEAAPAGFPAPFKDFSRNLSNTFLPGPHPNEAYMRSLKQSEAYKGIHDKQGRHLLPPSGSKTEAADKEKISNFSCVDFNMLSDQATPVRPHDYRVAFMMKAHRDRQPFW